MTKRQPRRLELRKETLRRLQESQLSKAAGGKPNTYYCPWHTQNLSDCLLSCPCTPAI